MHHDLYAYCSLNVTNVASMYNVQTKCNPHAYMLTEEHITSDLHGRMIIWLCMLCLCYRWLHEQGD